MPSSPPPSKPLTILTEASIPKTVPATVQLPCGASFSLSLPPSSTVLDLKRRLPDVYTDADPTLDPECVGVHVLTPLRCAAAPNNATIESLSLEPGDIVKVNWRAAATGSRSLSYLTQWSHWSLALQLSLDPSSPPSAFLEVDEEKCTPLHNAAEGPVELVAGDRRRSPHAGA